MIDQKPPETSGEAGSANESTGARSSRTDDLGGESGPAERLRRAADRLEARAAKAGGPDWAPWLGFARRAGHVPAEVAPWITMLGPQVASPLVAWLRDPVSAFDGHALAFADQILGGSR